MARVPHFLEVDARGVRVFRKRADELARSMEGAFLDGLLMAAPVLAVQCAISCVDAVCGRTFGKRAGGESHHEAAKLLETAPARDAQKKAEQFRRILDLKYAAEYEDRDLTAAEVRTLVERTRRLHAWMTEVLESAGA